ncbi:MAG TPA: Holliday junction resolvase RuvX [Planctomycetota bacterium]|nr:Holliday junction resolvase RuvX [Planctomycetota bacterium]
MSARPGAVVAVDYGEKRTGLAATDALRIAAMPIETVSTSDREELLERIVSAVDERSAKTLVVGLPVHLAGHDSARSRRVHELCAELRRRLPSVDVVEWDERLTTRQANSLLAQGGVHWRARKKKIDAVAAVVILRSYLEREHR